MSGTSEEKPSFDAELGRRLHRALTAGPGELFQVVQDPSTEVLKAALKNSGLTEDHLMALLKRRDLPEEFLKTVSRSEWLERSHRLRLALAMNPGTPGPVILSLLPHLYLFELLDLASLPGMNPDQRFAAEREILRRLPTVPLGNKITLARRGTPALLEGILKEGESRLIEACLGSPRLKEIHILQFLGGPKATAETISMIARHPKWKDRANIRFAILKNRFTPQVWFTLFLPRLRTPELQSLLVSRRLTPAQKQLAQLEIQRRGI